MSSLSSGARRASGPTSPVFPASLLVNELRYDAALESGDTGRVQRSRAALVSAIETLLEADQRRLGGLDGRPMQRREAEFLRTRGEVLAARLAELCAESDHTLAADQAAQPAPPGPADPMQVGGPGIGAGQVADEPAHQAREPGLAHRKDIQGLRAVAVLLVALSHAGVGFLAGGYIGVDVFFVLSGFLITGLLLSEARRRRFVSLADFYLRRMRRILPAAMLTLLVTDYAAVHLLNFIRAKQYLVDSIPSALFAANIHFAAQGTDYFAQGQPPSPFQHFWSLAVEEQFYVVWPALFALVLGLSLRRYAPRPAHVRQRTVRRALILVAAIALASLAWSISYTHTNAAAAYFSTFTRAWELALGAALAIGATRLAAIPDSWRTVMGWLGLALIAIAAVSFSASTAFPGYAALVPTVGAALVIGAGIGRSPRASAKRVLSVAPMRYIGDRSYTFYLWHWPVLVIARMKKRE